MSELFQVLSVVATGQESGPIAKATIQVGLVTILDWRLMRRRDGSGTWVTPPQGYDKTRGDKPWYDLVEMPTELRNQISEAVSQEWKAHQAKMAQVDYGDPASARMPTQPAQPARIAEPGTMVAPRATEQDDDEVPF